MRSAGYAKVIEWLSDIWREFPVDQLVKSYDACGITSRTNLHFALKKMIDEKYFF